MSITEEVKEEHEKTKLELDETNEFLSNCYEDITDLQSLYASESCNELKEAHEICIAEKLECNTDKDVVHQDYLYLYDLCTENCTEAIECIEKEDEHELKFDELEKFIRIFCFTLLML